MVTTEISQINGACLNWTNTLREQRTHFGTLKEKLAQVSTHLHDNDSLREIEHFQNQFYIQLINIHDLKHAIREHEQIAAWELKQHGQVSDAPRAAHDALEDQFGQLDQTLQEVEKDFGNFTNTAH